MSGNVRFDPSFFAGLRKSEQDHFWFRVRRKWILDSIRKISSAPAKALEIGCGTGNVSSFLADNGYKVVGCEYYKDALDMSWPGFDKVQGSTIDLPFADNSFDIVGLFDVIEHFDSEGPPLREARRVLKQNGLLILAVPARDELWSYTDDISFHKRRYSPERISNLLNNTGFSPISIKYIFMLLYLPMKILRRKQGSAEDSLKINRITNLIAELLFDFERIISRYIKLPVGTSIIAVGKK